MTFARSIAILGATIAVLAYSAPRAYAQHDHHEHAAGTQSLTGAWNMSLTGDHVIPVGLELTHEGTKLTGTLVLMGKEVPVEGEFVDGKLILSSTAKVMDRSGRETDLKITGMLKEDGTLAGEMATPHGQLPWRAERMKKRK